MSVIFLERQKEKLFFIPLLCFMQVKSCNCIKIEKPPEVFCKFLEILQTSQENTCTGVSFLKFQVFFLSFIKLYLKKDSGTGEFCEIFKNAFFHRTPPMAASKIRKTTLTLLFTYVYIFL